MSTEHGVLIYKRLQLGNVFGVGLVINSFPTVNVRDNGNLQLSQSVNIINGNILLLNLDRGTLLCLLGTRQLRTQLLDRLRQRRVITQNRVVVDLALAIIMDVDLIEGLIVRINVSRLRAIILNGTVLQIPRLGVTQVRGVIRVLEQG